MGLSPYKMRLWYPHTSAYEEATYSLEMKAPEIGNTERKARNQSVSRTRGGQTYVYDRGRDYNEIKKFQFRQIKDTERSQLLVFLEAVQWGAARLKMQHYTGEEFIIRVITPEITYIDTGYAGRNDVKAKIILWDFDLEILDLTANDDETGEDPPVSSALGLHLADFNHPHNPSVSTTVNIADGAKVVESVSCLQFKAVTWLVVAEKDDSRMYAIKHAIHDGYSLTDATTVTAAVTDVLADNDSVASAITLTVDINGAGASQVMRLKAATSVDGYTIRVRRLKL